MASQRGFSLIELFIVITLMGIFIGAVYESVIIGLRAVNTANDRENIRLQLTKALDQFTREASATNTVDYAQNQRFQFDADLAGNGNNQSNINYVVSGGILQRTYGSETLNLVSNLASLNFGYVKADGTTATSCDYTSNCSSQCCRGDVRVVQLTMTATKNNESFSMTGAVRLRDR